MDSRSKLTDVSPIVDELEAVRNRGFGYYDVFRDWVDLMLLALQRDDERYLDVLEDYPNDRDPTEAELFSRAFGELMAETKRTNLDVLGDVYEQFGMQTDRLGQHFTPHPVSKMMARLTGPDRGDDSPRVSDPACGSGRLLIYAAQGNPDTIVVAQDKDVLCAKMTALNFCFFNLDGYVIAGDSLKMEHNRAWRCVQSPSGGRVNEVASSEVRPTEASIRQDSTSTGD